MSRPPLIATYRLQLSAAFTFDDAIAILDHVAALGVSHLYLSPVGSAIAGSTHGYDWVPPPEVSPTLGGIDGLRALRAQAARRGLGVIVDIVPNHTGIADPRQNPWWWDVLTRGVASPFASFFDIDWSHNNGADGAIALPVLGGPDDLTALTIETGPDGRPELGFYDHRFPLADGTPTDDPVAAHDAQAYRLVPWDSGIIGYRRFFAVNELAGLRQEDPAVYDATHTLVRRLVAEDLVDGIRVDHPDGLSDPIGYLDRLRSDLGEDRWLVVEKILAVDEPLDPVLPVDGTTGYDALRVADGVFVNPAADPTFTAVHRSVTGDDGDARRLADAEHEIMLQTLDELFPAERARLARAVRIAARDAGDTDPAAVGSDDLDAAIGEVITALGVYRADYPSLRHRLLDALDTARTRRSDLGAAIALLAQTLHDDGEPSVRLAQVCGATTAKSVEDRLFYRTARLVCLQEVGGDPGRFGVTPREFHAFNESRAQLWPSTMTALSTHDTKRGEDVRTRIAVLTWHPDRWRELVHAMLEHTPPPDPTTGLFLLQNVVGVWPGSGSPDAPLRERLHDYTTKAIREAGAITTWTDVDDDAERAVHTWLDAVLDGPLGAAIGALVSDLSADVESICVAHKVIGLTMPGVPDVYQGTEWFEDSLVDPDNRRPVDFAQSIDHPKTRAVRDALAFRRRHRDALGGGYRPVRVRTVSGLGDDAPEPVIAFARTVDDGYADAVVVAARDPRRAGAGADATLELPDGIWRHHDPDTHSAGDDGHRGHVSVAEILKGRPYALLSRVTR